MPNSNYKTMIVVADDDEANRDLLSGMLGAEGLQISDVFDALTTERPYRTALQPPQALDLIRDEVRRGWWDGSLVNEFEAVILGSIPLQPARSGS
jgi:CheY-like chemotaxis protein